LLRAKKRYLMVRISPQSLQVTPDELREAVAGELSKLGGWLALAEAGISVRRTGRDGGKFILRCSLKSIPLVLLALTTVQSLKGERVRLDVTGISGTIKGLRR
jgi:RNase P/RNase MRP subunit POP5